MQPITPHTDNISLVVGGSNGIGLAVAKILCAQGPVVIVDKSEPAENIGDNVTFIQFDLTTVDYGIFDDIKPGVRNLVITAGFGRIAHFQDLNEAEITSQLKVNTEAPIRIIHHFYHKLRHDPDFNCAVMVSIAGFITSPLFSTYGASKAALKIFIESINAELEMQGSPNRILNVSPGSLQGTRFNNGANDLSLTIPVAEEIVSRMLRKEDLWIPHYEEIFKEVLARYYADFRKEGRHSYNYKLNSGRMK